MFCTREEVCSVFKVSEKTLNKLIDDNLRDELSPDDDKPVTFTDAFEKYSATGKASLRRAQYRKALEGNVSMQIWLGKQYLGQQDTKQTVEIDDKTNNVEEAVNDIIGRILDAPGAEPTQADG